MKEKGNGSVEMMIDYFSEFLRGFKLERLELLTFIGMGMLYSNWVNMKGHHWIGGIPIIIAMMSGAFHRVSLPIMMYLIPYTSSQREQYIEKMLRMKIGIPFIFAIGWDLITILFSAVSLYSIILQLLMVLIITYITGTLNDGTISSTEKKVAYGGIKDIIGIPLMLCYMGALVMFLICSDTMSHLEFVVVLGALIIIFLPIICMIRKRWKNIRANFADYEIAMQLEERK